MTHQDKKRLNHGAFHRAPVGLTKSEAKQAELESQGLSSAQIAEHLGLSIKTVYKRRENIRGKIEGVK